MFQCQGRILKGSMEIRLAGMPRVPGFRKEAEVSQPVALDQLPPGLPGRIRAVPFDGIPDQNRPQHQRQGHDVYKKHVLFSHCTGNDRPELL
jgi:hypothetical protein